MDNIQDNNTTMPEGMMNIQGLVSTLNDDPVSVAAITFDILRNVTNGFNVQHVVFLLVSITRDNLREYLRDTIFDAVRMDNELLSSDIRINDEVLENRLNEIWRQVTVKLRYAEKQKARRHETLMSMLDESKDVPVIDPACGTGGTDKKDNNVIPATNLSIYITQSQQGCDVRQTTMSGNDSTYNETNIKE